MRPKIKPNLKIFVALWLLVVFSHCMIGYRSADFTLEANHVMMTGVIDHKTPSRLRVLLAENPKITTIVLVNVEGSVDDEANLEAARMVRSAGLHTVVPANGLIASGGTDFFLAGLKRHIEPGAKVGVHSWALMKNGKRVEGIDVPRGAPEHQMYLDYYREMGVPEAFYWFTLNAAPADDIHWMSPEEMKRFAFIQ